ncbi:MAG: NADH-quinone oxidoreductase subunit L [Pirellulaceae bacterium]
MSDNLIILIPFFPLLAAILIAILGPKLLKENSHYVTVLAFAASFFCSLMLFFSVQGQVVEEGTSFESVTTLWTWAAVDNAMIDADGHSVPFLIDVTLRSDALTSIMLCMVTFIATLVAIFGAGYMHGDRGYWRFFAYVSLFVFSMTMLVSVSNFLLLFVFWEAVGLCSYLLIGFWYHKPEASAAGKKAFLVNRVGDFGFALAIFLIWINYGTLNFHDYVVDGQVIIPGVFGQMRLGGALPYVQGGMATAICLLLMLGACGKSAQFPLHVWLPDAMEGPTPVSALIHAATMVTAGVYMVTRCTPLFHASPDAQVTVACIGGFTALLAGLIALTQHDLKRVLAYSTVSQLGYMFLALGTGSLAGIVAGMFHLFTHAFFKALLFLGSGSVMHAMGNVIDMRRFGGLRHLMPWTFRTFLVGCLALAGIFPFAGFWSKDAILASVHDRAYPGAHAHDSGHDADHDADEHATHSVALLSADHAGSNQPNAYTNIYVWLYRSACFTAFLTAFYTFRAFFLTFYGPQVIPDEAGHHAHESPPMMWIPLAILAVFAFLIGFVSELDHKFAHLLTSTPSLAFAGMQDTMQPGGFHMDIAISSTIIAVLGIALAAFLYLGHQREVEAISKLKLVAPLRALSLNKFYLDEIYTWAIVKPLEYLGIIYFWLDRWLVDGLVNLVGKLPVVLGSGLRNLQTGLLPFYSLSMVVAMVILLFLGQVLWGGG